MKKSSRKNEDLTNVEAFEKSQVVGLWFVRVSRVRTVSIRFNSCVFCTKFVFFKTFEYVSSKVRKNARLNAVSPQILVNYQEHDCKITILWKNLPTYGTLVKILIKTNDPNIPKKIFFFQQYICKFINLTTKSSIELLRCGDIESNPGPGGAGEKFEKSKNGKIVTYNVRGIKEYSKLKRILNSCAGLIKSNPLTIINLQETHLDSSDINKVEHMWRGCFNLSPGTNRSRGCITLWGAAWTEVDKWADNQGRVCSTTLKNNGSLVTVVNIYAPNDHNINFFEVVFEKIIEESEKYDSVFFLLGDFNLVCNESADSVNRIQTIQEKLVSTLINENVRALQMIDCYRSVNATGGYTWNRGQCYSRLDMIFASGTLEHKIKEVSVDWAFDNSDHALVEVIFILPESRRRGPGLPRVDTTLLDNNFIKVEVESKLTELLSLAPNTWNPAERWEYIKMSIRSIMWEIAARERRVENVEIESIKSQLNMLKVNKATLIETSQLPADLGAKIDNDIAGFEEQLDKYWQKKSKTLALKARSKWFNEGEKSNKYFLNLIKKRNSENEILSLTNGEVRADCQVKLEQLVRDFYEDLYAEDKNLMQDFENFFPDCTKLTDEDRLNLDNTVTVGELESTLRSCTDSSPGPDGIVYSVYKKLWSILGKPLLETWNYSREMGILPESQRNSSITLLPKEGKDLTQIGNWRPITLTNCDLKVFTKTYANRVSLVLNKIIHPAQTAYIPGRVVHDNLRMFDFYKTYCNNHNVDAVLMSLDAKKAFDSVDHKYMYKTLKHYGFSDNFIEVIQLLYKDIKADILVNGYRTCMIKICRCVKQGDALSCALFILCIDPLIRRIERNNNIKPIVVRTPLTNVRVNSKCGVFADDVGAAIKNSIESINGIFSEYESFSRVSGIKINETKTEIMPLNREIALGTVDAFCYGKAIKLDMVDSIKICGVVFSNNEEKAYKENVLNKIDLLKSKMQAWQFRGLSMGGKLQVTKTFGISQLIYTMQICEYKEKELDAIERFIFGYLWSKNIGQCKAPDRIKRLTLKQSYEKGGLKVPDIRDLNSALKLKQFLRSTKANHVIQHIQKWITESLEYENDIQIEYARICSIDNVVKTGQIALNYITDKMRNEIEEEDSPQFVIDLLASINVKEYLTRKNKLLIRNFFTPLFNCGIKNLKQLNNESRFPRSDRFAILARNVIDSFPKLWVEIISQQECDDDVNICDNITVGKNERSTLQLITVKKLRNRLLKDPDVNVFTFEQKLGIRKLPNVNPFIVNRKANISEHMRMIKYRFLHCDIFCKQRMFKFKMTDNDLCDYCGVTETISHLVWECERSVRIWAFANEIVGACGIQQRISYESLFTNYEPVDLVLEAVSTKVIQLIFQIDRSNNICEQKLKSELIFLGNMYKHREQSNIWENIIGKCAE